jgi:hypothetical protein
MSNIPEEDDLVLPQEGSVEETVEFEGGAELVEMAEATEEVEALEAVEDDDVAPIVVGQADAKEVEDVEEEEPEEEEGPREPGLTTAGQYLAASCIAFMVVLLVVGIFFLVLGRFPFEAGVALIVVPVSLVCVACSIVGLLAKPEKREKLLLIPTLGPLLPLGAVVLFIIAILSEMKS